MKLFQPQIKGDRPSPDVYLAVESQCISPSLGWTVEQPVRPYHRHPSRVQRQTMLSSSDAKWRCMWHMMIWSISLTLVSQFLFIGDYIAFYIIAGISMIILPILTAVYNNTGGKHGAGLLRVGYVFCDPVMACITIVPILIFNHLPSVVAQYTCIRSHHSWNATFSCLQNQSDITNISMFINITEDQYPRSKMLRKQHGFFLIIQCSLFIPALLCLFMGRRSRKMTFNTHLLTFIYWLVTSIEAAELLDYSLLHVDYRHVIYTTEAIIAIVRIITHSYAVVTLCSYISPMKREIDHEFRKKFDFLYQSFVVISGVLFTEMPLMIARVQILAVDPYLILPGSFYMWLTKDMIFSILLLILIVGQRIARRKSAKMLCRIHLDTPNVEFQPEKRDVYIVKKKRVSFQDPLTTTSTYDDDEDFKEKKSIHVPHLAEYFFSHSRRKSISHESGLDLDVLRSNARNGHFTPMSGEKLKKTKTASDPELSIKSKYIENENRLKTIKESVA